jgi:glycerol-3-phosphate dehydrogenase
LKRDAEALKRGNFDILVIGGGINGAGIARDASLRGFKTALLEKGDFASGTSSKSSKLIHGGLRYLEQLEFKLVYEACRERRILLKIAPHIVKPIRFIIPIYKDDSKGPFLIKCGMVLYDLLASFRNVKPHKMISREEVLSLEPNLKRDGLLKGALYYDCYMNDSRLCLENILSAAQSGAVCVNYIKVVGFIKEGLKIKAVKVRDMISNETFEVRARLFINASGVWADEVSRYTGAKTNFVRPTKGVHLIIPALTKGNAILTFTHADRRALFVIPSSAWTIIGTTDTDYGDSCDEVRADREDVNYLLKEINRLFPDLNINSGTVINTYSGLRPLVNTGVASASKVTREHKIYEDDSGIITVIGGKYTTYRHMAQEVVDKALRYFPQRRPVVCKSADIPLFGGDIAQIEDFARSILPAFEGSGISPVSATHLINAYGSRWEDVFEIAKEDNLLERICEHNPHIRAEVVYAFRKELAASISDFMMRRTWIGYSSCRGKDCLGVLSEIMKKYLGFDEDRLRKQRSEYLEEIELGERFKIR